MIKKYVLYAFVACISIVQLPAQTIQPLSGKLTLQQCIETAISNNLQARQASYQAQTDKVNYDQAKGNQLPFLTGNIVHGINQGRSIDPFTNSYLNQQINFANYSLNTSITIWNGTAIRNNIRQNALNAQASEMDWQQVKDNLIINVILAYLQVLNNLEQLDIAKNQVVVTKNQVDRLQVLNNNGSIIPSLLYDMKGQLGYDELAVLAVKNNLGTAKLNLSQLLNISFAPGIELEKINAANDPALYDGTPDNIYQAASQQLAMIKAVDLRRQSAAKGLLAAKAQRLPVLSFNGWVGTNYSSVANRLELINTTDISTSSYVMVNNSKVPVFAPQNNYNSQKISYGDQWKNNLNSSVSIGLQFPIVNGLQARSRVNRSQILEKRAIFEAQTTKTQLKQAIDLAYINMNTALERYHTLAGQVADFTVSFHAAEARFNAGVNSSVEYMTAKNNADRANSNFISAKYDYLLRVKILDFYQGRALW